MASRATSSATRTTTFDRGKRGGPLSGVNVATCVGALHDSPASVEASTQVAPCTPLVYTTNRCPLTGSIAICGKSADAPEYVGEIVLGVDQVRPPSVVFDRTARPT